MIMALPEELLIILHNHNDHCYDVIFSDIQQIQRPDLSNGVQNCFANERCTLFVMKNGLARDLLIAFHYLCISL